MAALQQDLAAGIVPGDAASAVRLLQLLFDPSDLVSHKQSTREEFERAVRLAESGRVAEAIALLDAIVAAHPGDLAAARLRADATAGTRAA